MRVIALFGLEWISTPKKPRIYPVSEVNPTYREETLGDKSNRKYEDNALVPKKNQ